MADDAENSAQLRAEIAELREQLASAHAKLADEDEVGVAVDANEEFCRLVEAELVECRDKLEKQRQAKTSNPALLELLLERVRDLETARAQIKAFIGWKRSFQLKVTQSEESSEPTSVSEDGEETPPTFEFFPIGHVIVESAQLLIADPWIVHAFWKHEPVEDLQQFKDTFTGVVYQHRVDFHDFDEIVAVLGMSVTDAIDCGRLVRIVEPKPPFYTLSYNQISKANASASASVGRGVELAFDDGVPGAGVSVPLAADGTYPVFAETRDGKIVRIQIDI